MFDSAVWVIRLPAFDFEVLHRQGVNPFEEVVRRQELEQRVRARGPVPVYPETKCECCDHGCEIIVKAKNTH